MSRNTRLGVVAAFVAVAAVAFVVLRANDDNDKDDTAPTAVVTAPTTTAGDDTTTTSKPATPPVTTIRVAGGQPAGGVKSITVKKGDQIRFKVVDDESGNVHLHGYDIEKPVTPSKPASYSLPAKIDGVFVIELEDTGVQIGKLTVEP